MIKLEIIEFDESDYAFLTILVEVSGWQSQPCVDYCKFNKVIKAEYHLPPNIEERVEHVSTSTV